MSKKKREETDEELRKRIQRETFERRRQKYVEMVGNSPQPDIANEMYKEWLKYN